MYTRSAIWANKYWTDRNLFTCMGLGSAVGVGYVAYDSTEREDFRECVSKGFLGIMGGAVGGAVFCAMWPVLLLGTVTGVPIYAYQRIVFSKNKVAASNSPNLDKGGDGQHERQKEYR